MNVTGLELVFVQLSLASFQGNGHVSLTFPVWKCSDASAILDPQASKWGLHQPAYLTMELTRVREGHQ